MLLKSLAVALLSAAVGQCAISLVSNSTVVQCANSCTATTTGINTTGGTLLIAFVTMYNQSVASAIVTDSKTNTWRYINGTTRGTTDIGVFYAYDKSGGALSVGTSHTVSVVVDLGASASVELTAWSGTSGDSLDTSSCLSTFGTSIALLASPTQNNELIVSHLAAMQGSGANSVMTYLDGFPGDGVTQIGIDIAYAIQTTATSISGSWSGFTSGDVATCSAIFKIPTSSKPRRRVTTGSD